MTREWKPGDGAILRWIKTGELAYAKRLDGGEWAHVGSFGGGSAWDDIGGFEVVAHARVLAYDDPDRLLVVIDPEDREQVERLIDILREMPPGGVGIINRYQLALREFANPTPPKPDEPTGLGAVVEDADGDQWVRIRVAADGGPTPQWRTWWGHRPWQDIPAVRVLSEGVPS